MATSRAGTRWHKRKLDDAAKSEVLLILQDGGSRRMAAAIVGVSVNTIRNEADKDPEFLSALKKAEQECELFHIRRIKEGPKTWQSSAWFLERKWPNRYAKRDPMPPAPTDNAEAIRIRAVVRRLTDAAPLNGQATPTASD